MHHDHDEGALRFSPHARARLQERFGLRYAHVLRDEACAQILAALVVATGGRISRRTAKVRSTVGQKVHVQVHLGGHDVVLVIDTLPLPYVTTVLWPNEVAAQRRAGDG